MYKLAKPIAVKKVPCMQDSFQFKANHLKRFVFLISGLSLNPHIYSWFSLIASYLSSSIVPYRCGGSSRKQKRTLFTHYSMISQW